jgi:hypothetical protein
MNIFHACVTWPFEGCDADLVTGTADGQAQRYSHADTQGQSLPVFGLAALLGFELLPRIRNWHDLNFYRPDAATPLRPRRFPVR